MCLHVLNGLAVAADEVDGVGNVSWGIIEDAMLHRDVLSLLLVAVAGAPRRIQSFVDIWVRVMPHPRVPASLRMEERIGAGVDSGTCEEAIHVDRDFPRHFRVE